jgi:hypothetical protein
VAAEEADVPGLDGDELAQEGYQSRVVIAALDIGGGQRHELARV